MKIGKTDNINIIINPNDDIEILRDDLIEIRKMTKSYFGKSSNSCSMKLDIKSEVDNIELNIYINYKELFINDIIVNNIDDLIDLIGYILYLNDNIKIEDLMLNIKDYKTLFYLYQAITK